MDQQPFFTSRSGLRSCASLAFAKRAHDNERMMKKQSFRLAAILVLFFHLSSARAFVSPLSVSGLPPVQFPPEDFTVAGARASLIWGNHRSVYGFDLGVIGNRTTQNFVGLAVSGVFNLNQGQTTVLGLQLAGIANVNTNKTAVFGAQLAGGINSNSAESSVAGLQAALIANICDHTNIYGVQFALYNRAQSVYGIQIGLVNEAADLHGVQIGLVNFNHKGLFAVSPILNVGF